MCAFNLAEAFNATSGVRLLEAAACCYPRNRELELKTHVGVAVLQLLFASPVTLEDLKDVLVHKHEKTVG